ncbi:rhodanese-like domain-containing protein [Epibacterium sp. DP7N7-1]|jgi:rhodanese-related sulfurtransferase|uniref:rhodanese-like domain-containing protein n=1 Tax=Tritonibacter mobilis TaxID=379347 RepID=UPI0001B8A50C|nr:rhodanese-like domain-containing protein [Tritonibacter mobilis]EEW59812.1 rhodanese domain protein [Ruegeria sp. TrichCH4B]MBW3243897.1 rhodanese-like domain-containing protein [Epibacterium sp. DP7N7-1]MCZ4267304.1 rhodanese-like domain-containing protein [Rhodobacteraceae bacterium G21628-S1]NKX29319.1 rhodanese-like domain-containing protein [Rhodobacteraceae bacterium R_SAG6]NKX37215.1 rhodanese-like domain-containing protein [Rhodobacteraceae bacterium R_SAG4]NKX75517.1 rhodanese-lik
MTFISTKSCSDLVAEAESVISYISVDDAQKFLETGNAEFIDVRVYRELEKTGVIPGAHSCPRGLLEFWLDQESPYAREVFTLDKMFIFYCDNGWRSTLSTRLAQDMGLQNAHCLKGGLDRWTTAQGRVSPYHW